MAGEFFQECPPLAQRQVPGIVSGDGQDIERDVVRRRLPDQVGEGFRSGAQALLERGEVQPSAGPDHGYAVDHTPRWDRSLQGFDQFGQVPVLLGSTMPSRTSHSCTAVCVQHSNCRCVGHVLHVASSTIVHMSSILGMRCRG